MNVFSKLFSFLSGKKSSCKPDDDDKCCSRTEPSSVEKCQESGAFCRVSRVDQIVSPYSSLLTVSSGNENNDSESNKDIITRTLDRWNPETCVRLLRMPSVQNYSGLCKLISESDGNWMIEFLDMGGFEVLFESVDRLSSKNSYSSRLERTLLLLQCIKCLKAVVNSQTALERIIQQRTYVQKIAEVLSSSNPLVKKQLFDFMSTLCIFSEGGHYLTLDVLESYKVKQKLRYRFDVLLTEIKQAEVMPYVGGVLELINCIILGACGFRFRTRLRNEFLALGLQDLLESLKQIPDEDVQLQCSVFLKSELADEEYARSMGLRSSFSHFAIFQALLDKIEDTPLSASFLVLLQNLNQLDISDAKTDYVWSILEEISERASNGAGSSLRNWMMSECRRNNLKSTAAQTCLPYSPSLSINVSENFSFCDEDCEKLSLCNEDCEKESVKSFHSLDSGIPVSRNQSFASDGIRSPECKSIDTQTEKSTSDSESSNRTSCFARSTNSRSSIKEIGPSLYINQPTQTDSLQRNSNDMQSQKLPVAAESPLPSNSVLVEEGKAKKTFSFAFFSRSKKYSLPKSPSGNGLPPVSDSHQVTEGVSSRSGMTSIDVKRSRKQTQLFLREAPENRNISNSNETDFQCQSSQMNPDSVIEEPKMLVSERQVEPLANPVLPPPPPPPPPTARSAEVTLRQKTEQSLELPRRKSIRSSWSGHPNKSEFEKIEKRQHNTLPMPKSKMRTLNWAKVPSSHVSVQSIWSEISQEPETVEINFEEVEKLFCQNEPQRKETKIRQRKRTTSEISLLDSKRCLSINVFLKQFKGGMEEILEYVGTFKHKEIGAERLRTLFNLLPNSNEVKLLNSYHGDLKQLGTAERFLVRLTAVDNFECLIEGMLLLEEFPTTLHVLQDSVQSLLDACKELLTNQRFKNFLKLILVTGNFMNTGSYAGNAVGFRLSTLPKLMETRANKPRFTLLHYLVEETQRKDPDGIKFTNELLEKLSRCSRSTVESISAEITQLDRTMQKLNSQIKTENGQLKVLFSEFTENGIKQLTILKGKMEEINSMSLQLAKRFCEDEKKFQLEECLNVVSVFCGKIIIADSENRARKKADEKKSVAK